MRETEELKACQKDKHYKLGNEQVIRNCLYFCAFSPVLQGKLLQKQAKMVIATITENKEKDRTPRLEVRRSEVKPTFATPGGL